MLKGTNATVLVVTVGFLAFLTGSDLLRRPRWTRPYLLAAGALLLTELALNDLTTFAVIGVILGGWAIGLAVRWALGVASVRPTVARIAAWLKASGVEIGELARAATAGASPAPWRTARRRWCRSPTGTVRGSGVVRRLWYSVRVTAPRPAPRRSACAPSSSARRSRATARRPPASWHRRSCCWQTAAGDAGAGDVLPDGCPLDEHAAPEARVALFRSLKLLHRAGVAHRDLHRGEPAGRTGLGGFRLPGAGPGRFRGGGASSRRCPAADHHGPVGGGLGSREGVPGGLSARRRGGRGRDPAAGGPRHVGLVGDAGRQGLPR